MRVEEDVTAVHQLRRITNTEMFTSNSSTAQTLLNFMFLELAHFRYISSQHIHTGNEDQFIVG
ncbi:hypothetical protein BT69DRAFT_1287839 [Atractiella rhizophila]|nr:hypothetical protein BT69DRAFT_1287839 [Atractiella rhizophila]